MKTLHLNKAALLFGTALLILLSIGYFSYRSILQLEDDAELRRRTYERLETIQASLSDMKDIETGQRGYILTGEISYIRPYEEARGRIDALVGRLRSLAEHEPVQQTRIKALIYLLQEHVKIAATTIRLRRDRGFESAQDVVELGRGKVIMNNIRDIVGRMEATERELLAARKAAVLASSGQTRSLMLFGGFVALLIIGGSSILIARENKQRVNAEQSLRAEHTLFHSVLSHIAEGVAVADTDGDLLLYNPAAERIMGIETTVLTPKQWIDRYGILHTDKTTRFLVDELPLTRAARGESVDDIELYFTNPKDHPGMYVTMTGRPLYDENGSLRGGVIVIRDITEQKKFQEERECIIQDLQTALANVKALSGLLPICASCKKIRDDNGYWSQVEQYIMTHTDATFTHGVCPECITKLYGDLLAKKGLSPGKYS